MTGLTLCLPVPSLPGLHVGPEVGRGAGSTVYRASRHGVDYAVKILNTAPVDPGQILARFRREAALLAGVAHPRLLAVYEVGLVDGRPFLVMDLFDGRSLADLVRNGPLEPGTVIRLCLDLAGPLAGLHATGVIHRDVVPDGNPATTGQEPLVPYLGRDDDGRDVGQLTGYSASLVERVRTTDELVVITGTEEGAALGAQSVVLHDLRSIMVAPLQLEGRLLGVVYLDSHVARGIFTLRTPAFSPR